MCACAIFHYFHIMHFSLTITILTTMITGTFPVITEHESLPYEYSLQLLQNAVTESNKNIFVSVSGLVEALAMLYEASSGNTKKLLVSVAQFPDNKELFRNAYNVTEKHLQKAVGNQGVYSQKTLILHDESIKVVADFHQKVFDVYNAKIFKISKLDPQSIIPDVNDWLKSSTNNTLDFSSWKGSSGFVDPSIMIFNANYFKCPWLIPFEADQTFEELFTDIKGVQKSVLFMHGSGRYLVSHVEELQASFLKLEYHESTYSLVIILPSKEVPLNVVLNRLSLNMINDVIPKKYSVVDIAIPKFTIETTVQLTGIMAKSGLSPLFSHELNLSEMTHADGLRLNDILQITHFDMNEYGTVASSAVHMSIGFRSLTIPATFRADYPFGIMIYDSATGLPIYFGKVLYL